MADIFSKEKRSGIMSKVRNKDSLIEVEFRKKLWNAGFRYRKNSTKYFGKPDLVLKKYKTVIFIDSCFWHGCEKHGSVPQTNKKFWKKKIVRNIDRDREVDSHYKKIDWNIIRIWEHDLKNNFEYISNKITGRNETIR
jgi:DNA mismatch endonuclease (patch repair protein)